jgi:phosphatidate cytidylyltransferase
MAASTTDTLTVPSKRFRGLLTRVLSAIALAPLFLAALWFGFPWIDLLAALAAPLMAAEWIRLTRGYPFARAAGLVYGIAALVSLLWLRHQPALGRETVLWLTVCVWSTDIAAYFVGSLVGGAKLAPRISPGKTWSGLIGAMVVTALASAGFGVAVGEGQPLVLGAVGAILAIVGQVGDLLKSHAKRRAGVKDSGHLIPGHGGLLDRLDSFMAVLLVAALARLLIDRGWPWV